MHYMNDLETKRPEQQTSICFHELELDVTTSARRSADFDDSRNIHFVLLFNEKDVDILFERLKSTLKWPKGVDLVVTMCFEWKHRRLKAKKVVFRGKGEMMCFNCKKKGHIVSSFPEQTEYKVNTFGE